MRESDPYSCLALYDWTGDLDTVQFHELAVSFFDANGVLPNVCSVPLANGNSRDMSYAVMADRLRSESVPLAEGLVLYHTLPDYAQLIFGWNVTAAFDHYRGKTMYFCCDRVMRGLDLNYFEELLTWIGRIVTLRYGIGYFRSLELGPSAYAYGMGTSSDFSPEKMAEADRIAAWLHERMDSNRHLTGHVRDVYPLNVISQPHLSQRIDGVPLADWIGQTPRRGTLRDLPGGAAVWRIEESQVDAVRAELIPTGLLIAYPSASG